MELTTLLTIIWLHFIADFILQSSYMAMNKSKNIFVLLYHCSVYTIPFLIFGYKYALINGCLHFLIDIWTSKTTSYLYSIKKIHWFFVVIGLDQALHMTFLFLTYSYLR